MSEQFGNYMIELREVTYVMDRPANQAIIEKMISILSETKRIGGRLFILGVGGSAANASHAVNDFRKISGIEAYAPTDNIAELTARTNDESWVLTFWRWLEVSRIKSKDCVLVLSVSGGDVYNKKSMNIVRALEFAKDERAKIIGIVGKDGGYTLGVADACLIIPTINPDHIYAHAESFQSIIWHFLAHQVR
jgi:D-sedoheptulose 7-phosphate isomerase